MSWVSYVHCILRVYMRVRFDCCQCTRFGAVDLKAPTLANADGASIVGVLRMESPAMAPKYKNALFFGVSSVQWGGALLRFYCTSPVSEHMAGTVCI